jgi:hypothetical protein
MRQHLIQCLGAWGANLETVLHLKLALALALPGTECQTLTLTILGPTLWRQISGQFWGQFCH